MAKRAAVHCRICKEPIDRDIEEEGVDWIMTSKNFFFHKQCYDDWAVKKNNIESQANEEMWFDATWEYLKRDLKIPLNFMKLKKQWDSYIKKGFTAKGIYFCLRYFYEVKKGDSTKSEGGIGIIPFIYSEGTNYWQSKEQRSKGICARIEEQVRAFHNQKKIQVKARTTKIREFALSDIAEMDD